MTNKYEVNECAVILKPEDVVKHFICEAEAKYYLEKLQERGVIFCNYAFCGKYKSKDYSDLYPYEKDYLRWYDYGEYISSDYNSPVVMHGKDKRAFEEQKLKIQDKYTSAVKK